MFTLSIIFSSRVILLINSIQVDINNKLVALNHFYFYFQWFFLPLTPLLIRFFTNFPLDIFTILLIRNRILIMYMITSKLRCYRLLCFCAETTLDFFLIYRRLQVDENYLRKTTRKFIRISVQVRIRLLCDFKVRYTMLNMKISSYPSNLRNPLLSQIISQKGSFRDLQF